jgi:hypothetical protein
VAEGDHFDQARLLAETEEDARGSRREGIITPAFQRQLDALFDRLSQPATSDDLAQVVTSAEELAYVNADMPAPGRPIRDITEATGLSRAYASRIRWGQVIPHLRHWKKLKKLAAAPIAPA